MPRYETEADISREGIAAEAFANHLGAQQQRRPDADRIDRELFTFGGALIGLFEVKTRFIPSTKYDRYIVAKQKWVALHDAVAPGLPAFLVVAWNDRTGFVPVLDGVVVSEFVGGRWDRNDPNDVETMVEIPVSRFTFFPATAPA